MASPITVSDLYIYPVKSAGGIRLTEVELDAMGCMHDRRFMVVDATDGRFISQRQLPGLALVSVAIEGDVLRIAAKGSADLCWPIRAIAGPPRAVSLWDWDTMPLTGDDQGDAAAAWWSDVLDHPVRFVYSSDRSPRRTQPTPTGLGGRVTFSDGFPLLVASEESLADLNARLEQPIAMDRFRPNIVVRGVAPYGEDSWSDFRINRVPFRGTKPCARCSITTVDQATGIRGVEPLRTLARYRNVDGKVMFGQNAEHGGTGVVSVGDVVELGAA